MTRLVPPFAALLASLSLAPSASAQMRPVPDAPDPWVHKATETAFPSTIGDFHRRDVAEYNDEGTDASIGYDLVRAGKKVGNLSVYIFPPYIPDGGCDEHFASVKQDVLTSYPGVEQLSERDDAPSPSGGARSGGHLASFRLAAKFAGKEQPLLSDAYLFCPAGGHWFVLYRATWPADGTMREDVARLMHAIHWPEKLDR